MGESQFIFSIIIAIYNTEKYLSEAIESIINQTFDFDKVQIILVDDGSTDRSKEICMSFKEKYPKNIFYLYQENAGQSVARNNGLNIAKGKYVNFLDSDDKLDSNTLQDVYELFDKSYDLIDVCVIERYNFGIVNGPSFLNQKYQNTRIVDIEEECDFPQLSISASFIRRNALSERFNSNIIISEDSLVLNKTILKKCKFGVVGSARYLYRKRSEQNSTIDTKKLRREYFIPRMELYFKELINYSISNYGYVLRYIQSVLMYDLQWFFIEDTHVILNSEELNEFHELISYILQYIDDDIILSQRFLNKTLEYHILNIKYRNPNFKVIYNAKELLLNYNNNFFDELTNHNIIISDVCRKDNIVYLKGFYDSYFDGIQVNAYNNGNLLNMWQIEGDEQFSINQQISNRFHFMSIMELSEGNNNISFDICLNSKEYSVPLLDKTFDNSILFEDNELIFKYESNDSHELLKNNIVEFFNNHDEQIDVISFEKNVLEINLKPKVSIIVPVFNPGNLLYRCLDSIKNQSLKEIEIICVNDGSSDDSKYILEEYTKNDNRFKVFHQKNQGAGFSRNRALKNSTGEYIIFVDSDDWIEEDMCKKLYNHARNLDTDLVVFDTIWHTLDGVSKFNYFSKYEFEEDYRTFTFNHNFIKNKIMNGSFGVIWSKFYKSSFIKDNDIKFPQHKIYNDVEFHFKTTILAKSIAYYPEPFYHYVSLGQPSLQTTFREGVDELIWFDVLNGLYNNIVKNQGHLRLNFINYCIYYTIDKLKNIDDEFQATFLEKIKTFFKTLNPTQEELNSLRSTNSVWYTDKSLRFLPLYDNIMSENEEKFKLDLIIFKISESKESLEKTPKQSKEYEYTELRESFIKLNVDSKSLKSLPLDLSKFYISVLNFNNYESFNYYNNMLTNKGLKNINKRKLSKEIENFNEIGINLIKRDEKIIVSLTSFPDRIYDIHYCIYSLLKQKLKPDEVLLWLAEEQFPNKEEELPDDLLKLRNNGLTIKWCHDIRSYKKLIPALKEYPNDYIITVDDDIYYPENWLEDIWNQHNLNPNTIIASRARKIKLRDDGSIDDYDNWKIVDKGGETSFLNLPTGAGGTLYYPGALSAEVLNEPLFLELCPTGDDIWFWTMAVLNNTKITITEPPMNDLTYVNLARERGILDEDTLWISNKNGMNDIQIKNMAKKFPDIFDIINENERS